MYVCLCRLVTDRSVDAAIEQGAKTFGEVARRCGAGTVCGACRPAIERLLEGHPRGPGPRPRRRGEAAL